MSMGRPPEGDSKAVLPSPVAVGEILLAEDMRAV